MITEAGLIAVMSDPRQPNMTARQLAMLVVLSSIQEVSTADLAYRVNTAKPIITRYCDKMQDLGFIKRRRGTEDRRLRYISLTARGQRYLTALAR